jgi:hypothetical protein
LSKGERVNGFGLGVEPVARAMRLELGLILKIDPPNAMRRPPTWPWPFAASWPASGWSTRSLPLRRCPKAPNRIEAAHFAELMGWL